MHVETPGIIDKTYGESFKKYHKLTLSSLRTLGFGDHGVMEERINREVDSLVAEFQRHRSEPINPLSIVNGSVVNVIASILFGRRFELSDPALNELVSNVNNFSRSVMKLFFLTLFPIFRFIPMFRRHLFEALKIHDWILDFGRRNIDAALSTVAEQSFVTCFANAEGRDKFDREELVYIVRDLIVAGSETSSTMIMWAIVLLAEHCDVQKRLQEEIDSVIGLSAEDDPRDGTSGRRRLPSLADRPRLPFVEATILELMRYQTITPLSLPRETIGEGEIQGYKIPTGTMVMITKLYHDILTI